MQNINPSKNVNRRGRFYVVMGIFVLLGGLISAALAALLFVLPLLGDALSSPVAICLVAVGIPLTLAGIGLAGRGLTLQKDNPIAYEVGEALKRTSLGDDARYTYIRNISRRGLGYIDSVLVGPPGVLVFRTVNYTGSWLNERAEWRHRTENGDIKNANTNPTRECARDVYALRKFLKKQNLEKVPVYGIIVFIAPPERIRLQAESPVIPVAELDTLFRIMSQNYLETERINSSIIRATVDTIID